MKYRKTNEGGLVSLCSDTLTISHVHRDVISPEYKCSTQQWFSLVHWYILLKISLGQEPFVGKGPNKQGNKNAFYDSRNKVPFHTSILVWWFFLLSWISGRGCSLTLAVSCFRYTHPQHKQHKIQLLRRSHLQMILLFISLGISEAGKWGGKVWAPRKSAVMWKVPECH